jgi:hypothetical protein
MTAETKRLKAKASTIDRSSHRTLKVLHESQTALDSPPAEPTTFPSQRYLAQVNTCTKPFHSVILGSLESTECSLQVAYGLQPMDSGLHLLTIQVHLNLELLTGYIRQTTSTVTDSACLDTAQIVGIVCSTFEFPELLLPAFRKNLPDSATDLC